MKKKRPFYLTFPDQTIIIDTSHLPHREGTPIFSTSTKLDYLKANHPEKVNEYLQHLENFQKKFDQIEKLLKK